MSLHYSWYIYLLTMIRLMHSRAHQKEEKLGNWGQLLRTCDGSVERDMGPTILEKIRQKCWSCVSEWSAVPRVRSAWQLALKYAHVTDARIFHFHIAIILNVLHCIGLIIVVLLNHMFKCFMHVYVSMIVLVAMIVLYSIGRRMKSSLAIFY